MELINMPLVARKMCLIQSSIALMLGKFKCVLGSS